jgi:ElaB/YqjD/DUF883 family membrane-anchored ribosome-binding protein
MAKVDFSKLDKKDLIELLMTNHGTLAKKRFELQRARKKLSSARKRMQKMKDIILYQRKRILETTI